MITAKKVLGTIGQGHCDLSERMKGTYILGMAICQNLRMHINAYRHIFAHYLNNSALAVTAWPSLVHTLSKSIQAQYKNPVGYNQNPQMIVNIFMMGFFFKCRGLSCIHQLFLSWQNCSLIAIDFVDIFIFFLFYFPFQIWLSIKERHHSSFNLTLKNSVSFSFQ